jgi:hypothetical protein
MKNNFIPYKEALEMKQLGFKEDCFAYYRLNTWDVYFKPAKMELFLHHSYGDDHEHGINAPLWQQAFAWFRKKYSFEICNPPDGTFTVIVDSKLIRKNEYGIIPKVFTKFEDAQLACLKKLIETHNIKQCTPTKQN